MELLKLLVLLTIPLSCLLGNPSIDALKHDLETYLKTKKADVGFAVKLLETGDTLTLGNSSYYPMQSVYKFHLALAVLNQVDKGKLLLNKKILLKKKDLKEDTWSPMRDKYPKANIELTLAEILNYTISQSDNNGCDILFRLVGGTNVVNDYIRNLGFKDISIVATEAEMHKSWKVQFKNYSTPLAAVLLLEKFFNHQILSKESTDFLWNAMVNTSTGPDRIKGLLPKGTSVAHKTGSSGSNDKGFTAACNDIGIITLPNGKHIAIAVFVSNSTEKDDTNAKIIAEISKMCFDFFINFI